MFNADPKTIQKLAPNLERVMVIDPAPVSVRIVSELIKEIGARQVVHAAQTTPALLLCEDFDPQLIFVEFAGDKLDGLDFTQRLRRSRMRCRQSPVIMITKEATPASIIGARNSGVHEYLRKPFNAGDLYRRVENVILKPRPWIEAAMYVGPDRRRFNSGEFDGAKKRRTDKFKPIYADQAG